MNWKEAIFFAHHVLHLDLESFWEYPIEIFSWHYSTYEKFRPSF